MLESFILKLFNSFKKKPSVETFNRLCGGVCVRINMKHNHLSEQQNMDRKENMYIFVFQLEVKLNDLDDPFIVIW